MVRPDHRGASNYLERIIKNDVRFWGKADIVWTHRKDR